jgi:hypothetical protein
MRSAWDWFTWGPKVRLPAPITSVRIASLSTNWAGIARKKSVRDLHYLLEKPKRLAYIVNIAMNFTHKGEDKMTHAEMAKHIRGRLKAAGINARCSCSESCGVQYIRVNPPTYEAEFSDAEQATILVIADCNHLTLSRGAAIDLNQRTYSKTAVFEFHS